jgi:hypothetical protein
MPPAAAWLTAAAAASAMAAAAVTAFTGGGPIGTATVGAPPPDGPATPPRAGTPLAAPCSPAVASMAVGRGSPPPPSAPSGPPDAAPPAAPLRCALAGRAAASPLQLRTGGRECWPGARKDERTESTPVSGGICVVPRRAMLRTSLHVLCQAARRGAVSGVVRPKRRRGTRGLLARRGPGAGTPRDSTPHLLSHRGPVAHA